MRGVLIPRGTQFPGGRGGELAAFSRTQNPIIEIYMGKMM